MRVTRDQVAKDSLWRQTSAVCRPGATHGTPWLCTRGVQMFAEAMLDFALFLRERGSLQNAGASSEEM